MPSQVSPIQAKHWLHQIASESSLHDEHKLARECSDRLDSVVSDDYTTISGREMPDVTQLYALLGDKWLSDEHINTCRFYLTETAGPKSTVRIVSTFFLNDLSQHQQRHSTWVPEKSKHRKIDHDVQSGLAKTLLIPVHLPVHWALLVVHPYEHTYCYVDTLDLVKSPQQQTIDTPNWWLSSLIGSLCTLMPMPRHFETGIQTDSVSCGPAVMTTMSHIMLSTPSWQQSQANSIRMEWFMKFTTPSNNHMNEINLPEPPGLSSESLECLELSDPNPDPVLTKSSSLPTHDLTDRPKKPPKQSTLGFLKVGHKEYKELERTRELKRKAEEKALGELEAKLNEEKLLKKRLQAREKKQRQRQNKKAKLANAVMEQVPDSSSDTPAPTPNDATVTVTALIQPHTIAELSRPHRQSKNIISGHTTHDKVLVPAKHTNWMNPFLFHLINKEAMEVGYPWSPAEIVKRLKLKHGELFETLRPQRISDWRDGTVTDRLKWKDNVLAAIEHGNHPGGASTRQPLLAGHPEMVSIIKDRLMGLRITGTPVDTAMVRGFMIATIAENAPQLFMHDVGKGKKFRCSSKFVRTFLHIELNWSLRRPTQAAQKVPANFEQILLHAFLRMACAIRDENIPSCCIVNSDQTQVVYSPGTQYTWHTQGDKQVPVLGKEEKRAYTLLVGISNDGQLLPLQAIYQGASNASLPHPSAPGYAEAMVYHVCFVASMTSTYWSTLQTMKDYVDVVLVPFFQRMISTHKLLDDQRCIWQIDVWSVHRSEKFRDWLSSTYPWIILQYVPGGCTGLFQACDVGLQKIAKAAIRQKSLADIINETTQALRNGVDPKVFVNDKSIGTLRNRSVSWINEAIKAIDKPEVIRKAFTLCAVPDTPFNLSYACLTSHEARQAIRELKKTNPEFYAEIAAGRAVKLSEHEVDLEPEDDFSSVDELSAGDHARIVMESSNAAETHSRIEDANLDIEKADDESLYDPIVSETSTSSAIPESTPAKRELPRRAARENVSYSQQEWWNQVDLED